MERNPDLDRDGMKAYSRPGRVLRILDCEQFHSDPFPSVRKLFEAMKHLGTVSRNSVLDIDRLSSTHGINKTEARYLRKLIRNHIRIDGGKSPA